jgi:hypothetical protein
MTMSSKFKAFALFGALLLSDTHLVEGHGVELLSCLTTTGNLRVFVRHWHPGLSSVVDANQMVIDGTSLFATGLINDVPAVSLVAPWSDLAATGCSSPVVQDAICPPSFWNPAHDDDFVWYDFPTVCNVPASHTFEAGTSDVLREGCPNSATPLYPTTITGTFTDSTPPVIFVNGEPCSDDDDMITASVTTSECAAEEVPVSFQLSAADDCDLSPTTTSSPASGSNFPVGTSAVTVTSTDSEGNTSTCTFSVIISYDPVICSSSPAPSLSPSFCPTN